ncbi:MAG: RNA polymerase sigma factor [Erythrobacter sp.]|uniref:RNA polymerase sigma factor n=1 Tax=Erythrobacter sp. TaxID=1042 RepID=UPI003267D97C
MSEIERPSSLADVLEAQRPRFVRFLVARTRDADVAEDLLQDARAKLLVDAGDRSVSNPVPYIFQMLANLVEDRRRSEHARKQRGRDWGDRGQGLEPDRADHITPEQTASDRDMLVKTLEALGEMPERTRSIFLAYRVEGKNQKQIASDHGVSLSSVEKHLQRAYRAVIDIRSKLDAGL